MARMAVACTSAYVHGCLQRCPRKDESFCFTGVRCTQIAQKIMQAASCCNTFPRLLFYKAPAKLAVHCQKTDIIPRLSDFLLKHAGYAQMCNHHSEKKPLFWRYINKRRHVLSNRVPEVTARLILGHRFTAVRPPVRVHVCSYDVQPANGEFVHRLNMKLLFEGRRQNSMEHASR